MQDRNFYTPNDAEAMGETDEQSIQNAIALAKKSGVNTVHIPRFNARTGGYLWEIGATILLPSDLTLVLDNCHLRMKSDVFCNMFRNENAFLPVGRTLQGEQKNIRILGHGSPILDGGEYNGKSEHTQKGSRELKDRMVNNITILFVNVANFSVENIEIYHHRYWGMAYYFCRKGEIRNIRFEADLRCWDQENKRLTDRYIDYENVYIKNADGVDIRAGCHDIFIENISGRTSDDTVALTALCGTEKEFFYVDGKNFNISRIHIQNIRSSTFPHMANLRILNMDGLKIHDITACGIYDTSDEDCPYQNGFGIMVGSHNLEYVKNRLPIKGELYNITLSHVYSRAVAAVQLEGVMQNVFISDVHTRYGAKHILYGLNGGDFENVTARDLFAADGSCADTAFFIQGDFKGELCLENVRVGKTKRVFVNYGDLKVRTKDFQVQEYEIMHEEKFVGLGPRHFLPNLE